MTLVLGERIKAAMRNAPRVRDDDDDESDGAPDCPMCGGLGASMGTLGRREHFRCRACGFDFSREGGG